MLLLGVIIYLAIKFFVKLISTSLLSNSLFSQALRENNEAKRRIDNNNNEYNIYLKSDRILIGYFIAHQGLIKCQIL